MSFAAFATGRLGLIVKYTVKQESFLILFQNPLLNPGLVMDHPTARQDQILMQLSTLKQVSFIEREDHARYIPWQTLTLKVLSKIVADDILKVCFIIFRENKT